LALPTVIVAVRHTEALGNEAWRRALQGDDSLIEDRALREMHSSQWPLTARGVRQARTVGAWIAENLGDDFDRCYVSTHVRALQTAARIKVRGPSWTLDARLCEQDHGDEELTSATQRELPEMVASRRQRRGQRFFWTPRGGEPTALMFERVRSMVDRLEREAPGQRVLIVSHGELMRALHHVLTGLPPHAYNEWYGQRRSPTGAIGFGHVFHYTRANPHDPDRQPTQEIGWWRSVCPLNPSVTATPWQEVDRAPLTGRQLLRLAEETRAVRPARD
jgi:broad specificity phosphatase PhoE